MNVPEDVYERISNVIASDSSPVGIDAKKTHVIILHMLMEMGQRLERIEGALRLEGSGS
jgi:hypothetical protein